MLMTSETNKPHSAVGTAGRLLGVAVVLVGIADVVRQFADGGAEDSIDWIPFLTAAGVGVGIYLLIPALALWIRFLARSSSAESTADGKRDGGGSGGAPSD